MKRRTPLTVRQRLVVALTTLVTAALVVTGLTVWLIESRRIDAEIQAGISQEFAEFREYGPDVAPNERLVSFLESNLPDDGEILWAFPTTGTPSFVGESAGPLQRADAFPELVTSLLETGGTENLTVGERTYRVGVLPLHRGDERAALVVTVDIGEATSGLTELIRTYAMLSALWLLVIVGAAWWLAGRLLQPLRTLRDAAQEISAGSMDERIEVTGRDDLSALQTTFNDMLDRLDAAFVAQRTMLDDAAHELRTPLTVIRGHLEVVDVNDPDDLESTRSLVLDEVDRMARLVRDLLILAKAKRPDFVVAEPTDVAALMDGVVHRAQALADRDWVLDAVVEADVLLDGQRITQALLQLCENAVRFTTPDDQIGIGAQLRGDVIEFWVRDQGTGVPADRRDDIFERFTQADLDNPAVRGEGFGLGLSIVSAIAAAHGGSATLDPAGPTHGSTFRLTASSLPPALEGES